MNRTIRLTKDEARILSGAVCTAKYEMLEGRKNPLTYLEKLTELENKLDLYGNDKRRNGRGTFNDWGDLVERFCK